jgi:hypothetical protein
VDAANAIVDRFASTIGGMRMGGGVTVVMNGTVIREDADVPRIANEIVRQMNRADSMRIGRR